MFMKMVRVLVFGLIVMSTALQAQESSESDQTTSAGVLDLAALDDMTGLLEKLRDRRVVLVGETHDRYDHHLAQLAVIKGMYAQNPDMAIGLEFFQQPFQAVLDRFIAGEIDEQGLVRESEYFERWRYDYRLYRPIFQFAREKGIPLIALNLEAELTGKVSKDGIEGLSEVDRSRIPQQIDRSDDAYKARLNEIFQHHPHPEKRNFDHFYEVQLLWDEGMAECAARWLNAHPGSRMVVLAGAGHIIYGSGIPNRLKRRIDGDLALVLPLGEAGVDPTMGDYMLVTRKQTLPRSGLLGVYLDTEKSPVRISGFSDGSGAEAAGVQEDDRLLSVAGQPVASYADIRFVLMEHSPGERVQVEIQRDNFFTGTMTHSLEVELH
ncbi:putative iron-regulated protein [endosymbiont of Ridgeia piscesae]|uniref:Putative iron-regulated protein n=4 Tax=endosymbiont of Ridgeia piscesae TaxID=54398 RepID=A0A0T5YWA9_9GAMM|nr:putative iron-regulated protein [endosymbiont of Ridgeia piscesae]